MEDAIISDVICETEKHGIIIGDEEAEKLEKAIRPKIAETFARIEELISKPI